MGKVKREMENRGKNWTQVQQDREWEDREFFITVDPENCKGNKKEKEERKNSGYNGNCVLLTSDPVLNSA
jgi:hypothetical protein